MMDDEGRERLDDSDLVRQACQGQAAAWVALVRLHQEPVFRFAYLLLGDPDDAEDVAQETFIRAYHALHRFDQDRPLRPWLLTIAANLARNRKRSAARYLAALQRLIRAEPAHPGSLAERVEQRWEVEALWQAVQRLGQTDQQIIYARYFLELSIEEVAQVIQVPAGTVKSRLHRALGRLRGVIAREFPGLGSLEDLQSESSAETGGNPGGGQPEPTSFQKDGKYE